MKPSVTLWVSSVTGNTAKIAEGVRVVLEELGWNVHDAQLGQCPADDYVIVCFWCRKSSLDPKSIRFVESCADRKVLALGTFGGFPQGKYADLVRSNVSARIEQDNECLGVFLCQGKVRKERIDERMALPEDHPHHLDKWGIIRLTEGQKHPDDTDVLYAQAFVRDYLPLPDN